jgi:hypothetical protein
MSDGKNSRDKVTEIQARKLARARVELAKLDAGDLAEVLLGELDRRRLDAQGNPTDAPGLYYAAAVVVLGLLGRAGAGDVKLVERLAAVGRGELGKEDASAKAWELVQLLEARWPKISAKERVRMVARTLEKRFGRAVSEAEIAYALELPGRVQRVLRLLKAIRQKLSERGFGKALERR